MLTNALETDRKEYPWEWLIRELRISIDSLLVPPWWAFSRFSVVYQWLFWGSTSPRRFWMRWMTEKLGPSYVFVSQTIQYEQFLREFWTTACSSHQDLQVMMAKYHIIGQVRNPATLKWPAMIWHRSSQLQDFRHESHPVDKKFILYVIMISVQVLMGHCQIRRNASLATIGKSRDCDELSLINGRTIRANRGNGYDDESRSQSGSLM
jgi:hypothetical protein